MTATRVSRFGFVNAYLVPEDGGLTVIDTMLPKSAKALLGAAASLGAPITTILLTHAHGDHIGSLDELAAQLPDAEVVISECDARYLDKVMTLDPGEPQDKLRGGWPGAETTPTRTVSAGDRVGSLEVIASPGHTPGHVSLSWRTPAPRWTRRSAEAPDMAASRLDRVAVVAAAGRVADSDGLEAVTLARLARELGVRPPSLYNHVPSHTELLRLLATSSVEGLGAAIRDAAVGRSRGDALRAIAAAFRDYARRHPGRYSATVRAPGADEPEKEAAAADAVDPILAVLAGWSLEGDEAVHHVRVIRSALHGFALLEIGGGFGLPLDLDTTFERLVQTLEAGIRSAAGENP